MIEIDQEEGPQTKRRKVRKGTRSCWECKRRKVRCIFSSPTGTICDNCRRRGSTCISQELPDSPIFTSNDSVDARLDRVERFLAQLVSPGATQAVSSEDHSETPPTSGTLDNHTESNQEEHPLPVNSITTGQYACINRDLLEAWPSQRELNHIFTLPVGISTYMSYGICAPNFTSTNHDLPSSKEMLQLPPPTSHPVLIARKLLTLGIFLQGIPPSSIQALADLSISHHDIMSRVVACATRLVTTNDELIPSIEGVQCIMLEAQYQNFAGNLHQAWLATRRATAIAQMLSLHRGLPPSSLKTLDPATHNILNPDYLCFRLVEMDHYLSLMLGLPPTSLEARYLSPKALETCTSQDRMHRMHCIVAGRILHRTDGDINNLSLTQDIDSMLQNAAAQMSPQWWLIPDRSPSHTAKDTINDTLRITHHFTHYQLLLRLHLPYMLRQFQDTAYDQSKLTIITVSREILSRYIAFRVSNPALYYCRGVDFIAFVATTVLCIAHIDSPSNMHHGKGTIATFLAHSRPSDRGMMERTLSTIEDMATSGCGTDVIAGKVAGIMRHLLAVEESAAEGVGYVAREGDEDGKGGGGEYDGRVGDGGTSLHVYIPYYGTIGFERSGKSDIGEGDGGGGGGGGGGEGWDLQGVDEALFNSLFRDMAVPDIGEERWEEWVGV
ncbi:transcriptional regulator family: Fungal Specific TF [Aspergillus niger]|nr:transcriptional regulator family: Fungal Specific TF [Aspergillus niger]KAI3044799.1 transcriptional regulator family: Fungal Specific TF [Aspergillus niger]KAI3077798.1 transcriptional regulator family: Fungal Specific TF [Aspergillus niger]